MCPVFLANYKIPAKVGVFLSISGLYGLRKRLLFSFLSIRMPRFFYSEGDYLMVRKILV